MKGIYIWMVIFFFVACGGKRKRDDIIKDDGGLKERDKIERKTEKEVTPPGEFCKTDSDCILGIDYNHPCNYSEKVEVNGKEKKTRCPKAYLPSEIQKNKCIRETTDTSLGPPYPECKAFCGEHDPDCQNHMKYQCPECIMPEKSVCRNKVCYSKFEGDECVVDNDCPPGIWWCKREGENKSRKCVIGAEPCDDEKDCKEGELCRDIDADGDTECMKPGDPCRDNTDCLSGWICDPKEHICVFKVTKCKTKQDCKEAENCKLLEGQEEGICVPEDLCLLPEHCEQGLNCHDPDANGYKECTPPCESDLDCKGKYKCIDTNEDEMKECVKPSE